MSRKAYLEFASSILKYRNELYPEYSDREYSELLYILIEAGVYTNNLWCRQSGKSIHAGLVALHEAIFKPCSRVRIVVHSQHVVENVVRQIRNHHISVREMTTTLGGDGREIILDNGSSIDVLPISRFTYNPHTDDLIIFNDAAVSSSGAGSLESIANAIMARQGRLHIFGTVPVNVEGLVNTKVTWRNFPERNEVWAEKRIEEIGEKYFKQEYL